MYIVLAVIAAAAIGIGVHFALPRRAVRGVTLAPSIAGAAAAVVYGICTWSGLGEAHPVTWLVSIGVGVLLAWVGADAISRVRAGRDAVVEKQLGLS